MGSKRPAVSDGVLTILDIALVAAAGGALASWFGARGRFEIAGALVTVRSPTNLIIASLLLGGIRYWLDRKRRLFPAIPLPERPSFEIDRARFASPEPWSPRTVACAAAAVLGSLVWIMPHVLHPRMVPDPGDPLFSAWRIARVAHQLVHDPSHLFDGNIFHPLPYTLTLSDATFLQAMLGAPFVLGGVDPLLVANILTLVAFPACGLAFFIAGWRVTGDPYAGVIAGLLGAWYPFHGEHYSHLELQWIMFAPLAIVAGLRLLADPRPKTGALFGAAIALQWLASMYLGVMLAMFAAAFLLPMAIAWRVPARRTLVAAAVAAAVAAPAFAGLGIPYMKARSVRGERTIKEVLDLSALGSDYGHAPAKLANYGRPGARGHIAERELFPGTSTLMLAAAGAVPPLPLVSIGALFGGASAFDWSLGLNGLSYRRLYHAHAVFRGMRVTARFSVMVGTALIVLGAIGVARLMRRLPGPRSRAAACAALALLVLFDLRLDPRLQAYPEGIPPIYASVTPDMVLIELPVDPQFDFMYFSTTHWAPLVGGYSGYPKYSDPLMWGWKAWPAPESLDHFRHAGATHLTYNCALEEFPWRCGIALQMLDAAPQLELVASGLWQGKQTRLYRYK